MSHKPGENPTITQGAEIAGISMPFSITRRQMVTGTAAATGMVLTLGVTGCCDGGCNTLKPQAHEMDYMELLKPELKQEFPPNKNAIVRSHTPEHIRSALSARLREGGKNGTIFETFTQEKGVISFTGRPDLYEDLRKSHPTLREAAEKEHPERRWGRKRNEESVEQQREQFSFKTLINQYGIGSDDKDFLYTEGSKALDRQELKMATASLLESYEYVRIPAYKSDDLEAILEGLMGDEFKPRLKEFLGHVFILSPEGFWHIPREIIDEEKFKDDIFWIEFKQMSLDPYPNPAKIVTDEDRTTLSRQLQRHQTSYHQVHRYPIFTDDNREDLLYQVGAVEVPEEGAHHICKDIYTLDLPNEDLARYTYPETYALLLELGEYVNAVYHEKDDGKKKYGLPDHIQLKVIVNALGRTAQYQKDLRVKKKNGNAIKSNSSHTYYNAVDISYIRVQVVDTNTGAEIEVNSSQHPKLVAGVEALMHHKLAEAIEDGRALGRREVNNRCFHIVGKKEVEQEDDDSALGF